MTDTSTTIGLSAEQSERFTELSSDDLAHLREKSQTDLFFLSRWVLGYNQVCESAHGALCAFMTREERNRRMVLMPRGHLKCWRKSFILPYLRRMAVESAPTGEIVSSSYLVEDSGQVAEIFGITTEYGRYIEVSHNHPVYTWLGWKNAADLQIGDWVATPQKLPFGTWDDAPLAELFGYMVGDGDCVAMRYFNDSPLRRAEVQALIQRCGGESILKDSDDSRVHYVSVKSLRPIFEKHGVLNHRAGDKTVPHAVLHGTERVVRSFLHGLLESDGTIKSGRQGTTYCTISEQLARDVQHLLLKFGIRGRLYRHILNNKLVQNYPVYHVHFTDFAGIWHQQDGQQHQHDNFPPSWRDMLEPGWKLKLRKAGIRIDNKYASSRDKVRRVAEFTGNKYLLFRATEELCWEQVTKVESLGQDQIVSIQAAKFETLLIGDILTHNTTICTISDSIRLTLKDPNTRVLIQNEVFDNAADMLSELKNHWVRGDLLRNLFPELVPPRFSGPGADWSKDAASIVRTSSAKESTYTASGSGGSPQSKHFMWIKNDDLIGEKHKESEAEMQRAIRWSDAQEPLLDSPVNQLDYYGTRKTMADVYTHQMEKYGADLAVFIREPIENDLPIFPEKYPMDALLRIMNTTPEVWAHDFMNNPIGKGGLDWGKGLLRTYDTRADGRFYFEHHLNSELYVADRRELDIVITVDPNSGKLMAPDKAAVVVHGVSPEEQIFVLESWSGRVSPEGLIDKIWEFCCKWNPRIVGIEDAGQQNTMYYFEKRCAREGRYFRLKGLQHRNVDKERRIRTALDTPLKARRIYVQPAQLTLIGQIQLFPQLAAHNWDEIDAFSYGPEVYQAGVSLEALEADEEAETKIFDIRGATGYGVSVGVA